MIFAEPSPVCTLLYNCINLFKAVFLFWFFINLFVTSELFFMWATNTYVTFKLLILLIMCSAKWVDNLASIITSRDTFLPNVTTIQDV